MKSSMLESFNSKALSKASTIRIVGGDDATGVPTGTDIIVVDGTKPKTTPISSTATHIKPDDEDLTKPLTLQLP